MPVPLFFWAGYIAVGEEIIYNYGAFVIISGWAEFGFWIIDIYHGGRVKCNCDIIHNLPHY